MTTPRKPGRPTTPEGPRKHIVKVSLNDKELEAITNVTNAPAQFMREAALKVAKRNKYLHQ